MAGKKTRKDVDAEIDLHGMNAEGMRLTLEKNWDQWRGLRKVRVIHGQGTVLRPELQKWCLEMGIPIDSDYNNFGSSLLFPRDRTLANSPLFETLKDKGLRLTPEQEAYLRDPVAIEKGRKEALKKKQDEETKRQRDAADVALQRRKDEALWKAELSRLTTIDRSRKGRIDSHKKPGAPIIIPPIEIKHQEGYWRAELVRVAETETEILQIQKKTGLDKLAKPLEAIQAEEAAKKPKIIALPRRNVADETAMFEAEMSRLLGDAPNEAGRSKK